MPYGTYRLTFDGFSFRSVVETVKINDTASVQTFSVRQELLPIYGGPKRIEVKLPPSPADCASAMLVPVFDKADAASRERVPIRNGKVVTAVSDLPNGDYALVTLGPGGPCRMFPIRISSWREQTFDLAR